MSAMEERTVADVEAMMDDPDAWGDPEDAPAPRSRSEKRQRSAVISVRLKTDELRSLEEYARVRHLSVSGALRAAGLEAAAAAAVVRSAAWPAGAGTVNGNDSATPAASSTLVFTFS
jgi:hypothetical protein